MKALSLVQPYADLILSGKKTIELRNWAWRSSFKGRFLVHSSQRIDLETCQLLGIDPQKCLRGYLLGESKIIDRYFFWSNKGLEEQYERHFAKDYFTQEEYDKGHAAGFVLEPQTYSRFNHPQEYRGALGFFEVPDEVIPSTLSRFDMALYQREST